MKFTLFPNLASEIRDMIWRFALPGHRKITVTVTNPGGCDFTCRRNQDFKAKTDCHPIATALLHTCVCSRNVALQEYEIGFAPQLGAPLYFSSAKDTLCFSDSDSASRFIKGLGALFRADEECIQRLRHLEVSSFEDFGRDTRLLYTLCDLEFLETFTIQHVKNTWTVFMGKGQSRKEILQMWEECYKNQRFLKKGGDLNLSSILFVNDEESNAGQG